MYRKSKKLLAWSLVVCMIVTQMLFSSVALAADKANLATDRFAGADRYATAIEVSKAGWTTSDYAVLAYGEGFADALAAAPLAKKLGAPILLTGKDALPAGVLTELQRLGVKEVYIVGGEGVVSKAVEDAVLAAGMDTTRLWGTDRYMTALAVAQEMGTPDTVVLAYGENYADALSVSAIAAAKGWPILLTGKDAIDADVKAYIGSKKVYVVGGTGVVSDAVLNQFDGAVRLGGVDRYDTNLKVLEHFAADLNFLNVFMATGEGFADALAGSVLAAMYESPLVLVGASVAPATLTFLSGKVTKDSAVFAFGGPAVVSDAAVASVAPTVVVPTTLEVESVTALNLNFIKVVFTKEVDETAAETASNYTLGGVDLGAADTFELQSDNKTLYITLDVPKAQYENAIFKVKGNVVYSKDLLTTAPAKETTLTFSDVTAPTVKSVTVSGNKKLTVEFSEPVKMTPAYLAAAGTNYKIDGQNIVNYSFTAPAVPKASTTVNAYVVKVDLNFANALPAGNHTLTVAKGTATDLIDAAGFKVAEQTLNFTVDSVTDAPKVVSVTGENNGTIYVTYDRKMESASALLNTNYSVNGVNPAVGNPSFKSGSGDTVVKMTIAGVVKGANVLEINKEVKDVYGNKLDPDNNLRVSFTATEDVTKPSILSVTAVTNTKIRVKFSEDVSAAYATNANNYTLKDSSGNTIAIGAITAVPVGTNSDTYEITVAPLTGSNYTLKIKNVVDLAANPNRMDEYTATFNGNDDVAPNVTSVVQVANSTTKVAITFNEKMDAATLTNLANYYYQDNKATPQSHSLPSGTSITVGEDNKSVQITFPSAYTVNGAAATEYSVMAIRIANVKDEAGNLLSGVATAMLPIAAAGSGADNPTYVDKSFKLFADSSKVWAEFEFNQSITSLNIADFTVAGQAPDSGYMSGKKVVLNFTNAAKIAAIKAAGNSAVLATVATPTSTNVYGTPITAYTGGAAITVYDDQIAPKILLTAGVATITTGDGTGTGGRDTITITFTENIDATIAGLYKNDFTFERNGVLFDVDNVVVAGPNVTFELKGVAAAGDNFAAGDGVAIIVKAVAANIDIKDEQDRAENQNVYVPETKDTNGTWTVTP